MYADEPYYKDHYLLGRKPVISSGFAFYARSASKVIDQYTFDRLKGMQDIPETVKMCCCELAEAEFRMEKQRNEAGGKTSEKVSAYSVSFASAKECAETKVMEQRNVVMKWLADTGLLYQGV